MITINDKKYNDYDIEITWGEFSVTSYGKKRNGIAPFISFNIENRIFIGLEFTFSVDMFKQLKENVKTNINEYITDITYEDERGWISVANREFDCNITKTNKNNFVIDFFIKAEENISINSIITLCDL